VKNFLLEAQRLSHTGSWHRDVASGVVTISPEMGRIWGVGPGDDSANAEYFWSRLHPEDRSAFRNFLKKAKSRNRLSSRLPHCSFLRNHQVHPFYRPSCPERVWRPHRIVGPQWMSPKRSRRKNRSGEAKGSSDSSWISRLCTSRNLGLMEVLSITTRPRSIITASLLRSGKALICIACFIHRMRNA